MEYSRLMRYNKYSGKFWWHITEQLFFVQLLAAISLVLIPSLGLGFSIKSLAAINQQQLELYGGMISLNFYVAIIIAVVIIALYFPCCNLWRMSRKFARGFYCHGQTKPELKNNKYVEPRIIWEKTPPL